MPVPLRQALCQVDARWGKPRPLLQGAQAPAAWNRSRTHFYSEILYHMHYVLVKRKAGTARWGFCYSGGSDVRGSELTRPTFRDNAENQRPVSPSRSGPRFQALLGT